MEDEIAVPFMRTQLFGQYLGFTGTPKNLLPKPMGVSQNATHSQNRFLHGRRLGRHGGSAASLAASELIPF